MLHAWSVRMSPVRPPFLEALRRLNPAQGKPRFVTAGQHYPAWLEKKHRRQGQDLEAKSKPSLHGSRSNKPTKMRLHRRQLGEGVFKSDGITVSRTYGGTAVLYNYTRQMKRARSLSLIKRGRPAKKCGWRCRKSKINCSSLQEKATELQASEDEQT